MSKDAARAVSAHTLECATASSPEWVLRSPTLSGLTWAVLLCDIGTIRHHGVSKGRLCSVLVLRGCGSFAGRGGSFGFANKLVFRTAHTLNDYMGNITSACSHMSVRGRNYNLRFTVDARAHPRTLIKCILL